MQVNSCSDNELTTVGSDDFHELGWVGLRFDERVCCSKLELLWDINAGLLRFVICHYYCV